MSDEPVIPADLEAALDIRIILIGSKARSLRALCEMYKQTPNELAERLIAIGAADVLGEIQYRERMRKVRK